MSRDTEYGDARDYDEETVEPTGRFRIYLGAVAGVGKTWAMLDEGWRRHKRGADVVVGFVETHGRAHTAEQIRDLEVVPRKVVEYRGTSFEEMDLEAVLARNPEVALIDEIAHTNVPGSGPHPKRWEDVLQILDAGISVVSTVNIQHVESVADAVQQITGVAVRERVPDWVLRRADQLELIDSSPEQLRRRMLHGNIYPPEKIPAALAGFFRQQNLVALRELALRFVADETEEELLEFLAARHPDLVWDTAERIMVAVTATPGTDVVLRRAARIALRVKADLKVVHVVCEDSSGPASKQALADVKHLAEDLGASWHEITSDDPASAIVKFAKEKQVTQVVLGASRRSRWQTRHGEAIGGPARAAIRRPVRCRCSHHCPLWRRTYAPGLGHDSGVRRRLNRRAMDSLVAPGHRGVGLSSSASWQPSQRTGGAARTEDTLENLPAEGSSRTPRGRRELPGRRLPLRRQPEGACRSGWPRRCQGHRVACADTKRFSPAERRLTVPIGHSCPRPVA